MQVLPFYELSINVLVLHVKINITYYIANHFYPKIDDKVNIESEIDKQVIDKSAVEDDSYETENKAISIQKEENNLNNDILNDKFVQDEKFELKEEKIEVETTDKNVNLEASEIIEKEVDRTSQKETLETETNNTNVKKEIVDLMQKVDNEQYQNEIEVECNLLRNWR